MPEKRYTHEAYQTDQELTIMSINTWIPAPEKNADTINISTQQLQELISIGKDNNIAEAIMQLSLSQIDTLAPLMKQPAAFWHNTAAALSAEDIVALIRFFTLAEEKHSALFAGNQSPVIALNKLLRKRDTPLPKAELLWIKAHSSNRFLPNGSIF